MIIKRVKRGNGDEFDSKTVLARHRSNIIVLSFSADKLIVWWIGKKKKIDKNFKCIFEYVTFLDAKIEAVNLVKFFE